MFRLKQNNTTKKPQFPRIQVTWPEAELDVRSSASPCRRLLTGSLQSRLVHIRRSQIQTDSARKKSLTLATFYWCINNWPFFFFFMEEIIRGSKRLVFHLMSLLEGLTFIPLLRESQENFVYSLLRHIHRHCFVSIWDNFTVTTCAKRKSSNDSFKRAFNACMKQAETQNTGGCMSNTTKLALGQGCVAGGAAAQGMESVLQILQSAFLGGYHMVLKSTYSSYM